MLMSLLYYGDLVPHSEQCLRERCREEEKEEAERVGKVVESDLPTKEKVEIIEKTDSEREEEERTKTLTDLKSEDDKATSGTVESFSDPLDIVDSSYNDGEVLYTYPPLVLPTLDPVAMGMMSSPVTMPTPADLLDFDTVPLIPAPPPPVPMVTHNIPPAFFTMAAKKKLTKHHNYKKYSMKYAPGDYTNVPMPCPPDHTPADASNDLDINPYHTYLISSTVDYRLRYSLEYPIELSLQNIAHIQYEAVMRSLLTASPPAALKNDEERKKEKKECGLGLGIVSDLNEVCIFVCNSLETLLKTTVGGASSHSSSSSVDVVSLLKFWHELNTIYPTSPSSLLKQSEGQSPTTSHVVFCSTSVLTSLIDCLNHAPSDHTHSDHTHLLSDAKWQIGLTLLNQFITRLYSSSNSSSLQHDRGFQPLHFQALKQLLIAYFLSGDRKQEVGVEEGVVLSLLKQLVSLDVIAGVESDGVKCDGVESEGMNDDLSGDGASCDGVKCGGASGDSSVAGERGGDNMRGVHVLFDVLVHLLEKR